MRKRIEDEFTHLRISRQRKYQLRMLRDKRCTECGEPAVQGSRCLKHLIKARERQRKKRGLKRRYINTLSYRLEELERSKKNKRGRKGQAPAARKRAPAAKGLIPNSAQPRDPAEASRGEGLRLPVLLGHD